MHGLGVGHGMHVPGTVDVATAGSASSHHVGHSGPARAPQDAETAPMASIAALTHESLMGTAAALGHDGAITAAAVASATTAALTSTDDLAAHGGALCTAVLPALVGLLMLVLALAALRSPGGCPPVRAARRVRARARPPTRHTTSLIQLCVSRT